MHLAFSSHIVMHTIYLRTKDKGLTITNLWCHVDIIKLKAWSTKHFETAVMSNWFLMNETYSQKSDKTIHIKYAINNSSLHIYFTFPLIYFFFLFIGYINGLPLCLNNIALHLLVTRWYLHGLAFSAVPSRLVPIDMCPLSKGLPIFTFNMI